MKKDDLILQLRVLRTFAEQGETTLRHYGKAMGHEARLRVASLALRAAQSHIAEVLAKVQAELQKGTNAPPPEPWPLTPLTCAATIKIRGGGVRPCRRRRAKGACFCSSHSGQDLLTGAALAALVADLAGTLNGGGADGK